MYVACQVSQSHLALARWLQATILFINRFNGFMMEAVETALIGMTHHREWLCHSDARQVSDLPISRPFSLSVFDRCGLKTR